jgi:hypothetical protein
MKKVIRLTEDDLTRLVKRVIKEQPILGQRTSGDIVSARTNLVTKLKNKGYRLTKPGETGKESTAFKPKRGDLMIGGYDGKPLVFSNGLKIISFERDGSTIGVYQKIEALGRGRTTFYKLPKDLNQLENLL